MADAVEFLSASWIEALARAAARATLQPDRDTAGTTLEPDRDTAGATLEPDRDTAGTTLEPDRGLGALVVQQVVTGEPEVSWHLVLDPPGLTVATGHHRSPSITFTQDRATAAAVASGRLSAQGAFMAGRLRVGGDVQVLLDRQDDLAAVDRALAPVRALTTFPPDPPATRPGDPAGGSTTGSTTGSAASSTDGTAGSAGAAGDELAEVP